MKTVKTATFNVNSLKARLPIVERFLRDEAPDIVCFQETKCQDADFPKDFFGGLGYNVAFKGMKSYNGVAIASRDAPDECSFGFQDGADSEQDTARVAIARFGAFRVINTYVPQGKSMDLPDFQYKLRFFERLTLLLERRFSPSDLLLWTGDINVAPTDIDVTHPENKRDHVCVCQESRDALAAVLKWGMTDVYRKHRPDPGEFSFWDYRVKDAMSRNIGWRIDHFFATPPLAALSTGARAVKELRAMERPSDHTAVIAEFAI
ncbi:MAG: exodeoxyribonuclease III [Synergistaceae bacterium]|jgi:exodeoxyribonuclease-3|nr:exodeoxyribonuclease III [Synergistaceae bacterium]